MTNRREAKLIERERVSGGEFDDIGRDGTRPLPVTRAARPEPAQSQGTRPHARPAASYTGVMGEAIQRREAAREPRQGEIGTAHKVVASKSAIVAAAPMPQVMDRQTRPSQRLATGPAAPAVASMRQSAANDEPTALERLDIFRRSLEQDARQQVQHSSQRRPAAYDEHYHHFADDMRDAVLYYTSNANAMLLTCVVMCCILIYSMVATPLGEPLGIYQGPKTWSGWFAQWGGAESDKAQTPFVARPAVQAANGENSILGGPTISAQQIDDVLASYGSPAAGSGQAFYDMGVKYGIDPAYALAFFIHESSAGTNPGWAGWKPDGSTTHNIGNIICAGYTRCFNRFRDYASWSDGIEDWYKLIAVEYVEGRGTTTVEQIIPIYAPSFENDVPAYVNAVTGLVNEWRSKSLR